MQSNQPFLSIIIPLYEEASNLADLTHKLAVFIKKYQDTVEVILVDDGSQDETEQILKPLVAEYPWLKAILLSRNYGQSAAMTAGFQNALGKIIVSMDGDLQNDPADIPRLIAKLDEGYDVVCGWRKDRKDDFLQRKLPSKIANWLIVKISGVKLHDYGCSLKAYRSKYVENLILYGELHRFIPILTSLEGACIAEIEVNHYPRTQGKSKYGIGRMPKVLLDLLLMYYFQRFATRPLHFFGRSGLVMLVTGFVIEIYLTGIKLFLHQDIGTRPLLLLGALLIISGIMLVGIGIIAELLVRIYHENGGRHIYLIKSTIEHGKN
ncbi:MAG: glycosyltransferase family 2 protein [Methylococcaceae bacterium]